MEFNSQECAWADMSVKVFDSITKGIRGIRYKKEVEKEALYAAGDEPVSIQHSNKKYEGSIKLLKGELDRMNAAARNAGFRDITEVPAQLIVITVNYKAAFGRAMQTDVLQGVSFSSFEKGWDQGAKFMEMDVPIMFLGLTEA